MSSQEVRSSHVAAGLAVIASLPAVLAERRRDGGDAFDWRWIVSAVGWVILLLASVWFAPGHRDVAFMSAQRLVTIALLAGILALLRLSADEREQVARCLAGGLVLAGVVGLAHHLLAIDNTIFWGRVTYFGGERRLTQPFGHANVAGACLGLGTCLLASLLAECRTLRSRLIGAAGLAVLLLALSLTYSRIALVGTAIGLVVTARHKRVRLVAAPTMGALALAISLNPTWWLRASDPPPEHWFAATITAPPSIDRGPLRVEVTNDSRRRWPPSTCLQVEGFGENQSAEIVCSSLAGMEPNERRTLEIDLPDSATIDWLRLDVRDSDTGSFVRRVGGTTPQVVVNPFVVDDLPPTMIGPTREPVRSRLELWTAAYQLVQQRPLFGVGVGNFRLHYQEVVGSGPLTSHAHSVVLEPLASWGIPAAVLGWLLWASVWVAAWRRADALAAGIVGAFSLLLVTGLTDWLLEGATIGIAFGVLAGLSTGQSRGSSPR